MDNDMTSPPVDSQISEDLERSLKELKDAAQEFKKGGDEFCETLDVIFGRDISDDQVKEITRLSEDDPEPNLAAIVKLVTFSRELQKFAL